MTVLSLRRLPQLAALVLAGLLAACAGTPGPQADLTTASDQTSEHKRAEIRLQLAAGYYEQGQYTVALDEVKKAIVSYPDYPEAYSVRGLIYMALGEMQLADGSFQQAMKLAPNNPETNNNYGYFLCQRGQVAESFRYFDAALAVRSYSSPGKALNNAGACALKVKDTALAEKYLLAALQQTPDLPATNANLAKVYYDKRDYVRAGFFVSRLNKVAKVDTLSADVLWLAIKVQHKLGDTSAQQAMATQLRRHHATSPEYAAYQRGAFDE